MLARAAFIVVILVGLWQAALATAPHNALHRRHGALHRRQDADKTNLTSLLGSNMRLASPAGQRPGGAFATTYQLSGGDLFAWQSKTPHNEADATSVVIVTHGVDRNANAYFTALNDAYRTARDQNKPLAGQNVLRIAPLFFATEADAAALNKSTLAWGKDNDWAMGSGSTHPKGSDMSSLTVYDELISRFSDKNKYPKVKTITLVGHGGGALITQRYAALRQSSDDGSISLRYVVGNPSSMLYFTTDRPSPVDESQCDYYNLFYYGLDQYEIPYSANVDNPGALFTQYAARDVRYLVSLDDTSSTNGDQSCGARAMGGAPRKDRSLSYWKYINLLAGGAGRQQMSKFKDYPGQFASMQDASNSHQQFLTNTFNHKLSTISQAGHEAAQVFASKQGLNAIFGN